MYFYSLLSFTAFTCQFKSVLFGLSHTQVLNHVQIDQLRSTYHFDVSMFHSCKVLKMVKYIHVLGVGSFSKEPGEWQAEQTAGVDGDPGQWLLLIIHISKHIFFLLRLHTLNMFWRSANAVHG